MVKKYVKFSKYKKYKNLLRHLNQAQGSNQQIRCYCVANPEKL